MCFGSVIYCIYSFILIRNSWTVRVRVSMTRLSTLAASARTGHIFISIQIRIGPDIKIHRFIHDNNNHSDSTNSKSTINIHKSENGKLVFLFTTERRTKFDGVIGRISIRRCRSLVNIRGSPQNPIVRREPMNYKKSELKNHGQISSNMLLSFIISTGIGNPDVLIIRVGLII